MYSKSGTVFKNQDFLFEMGRCTCTKNNLKCHSLFRALHTSQLGQHEFAFDGHLNVKGATAVAEYFLKEIVGLP